MFFFTGYTLFRCCKNQANSDPIGLPYMYVRAYQSTTKESGASANEAIRSPDETRIPDSADIRSPGQHLKTTISILYYIDTDYSNSYHRHGFDETRCTWARFRRDGNTGCNTHYAIALVGSLLCFCESCVGLIMGKEQALLEAARTGNVLLVEKLLRGKRGLLGSSTGSIPLPGLLRYVCTLQSIQLSLAIILSLQRIPRVAILFAFHIAMLAGLMNNGTKGTLQLLLLCDVLHYTHPLPVFPAFLVICRLSQITANDIC